MVSRDIHRVESTDLDEAEGQSEKSKNYEQEPDIGNRIDNEVIYLNRYAGSEGLMGSENELSSSA